MPKGVSYLTLFIFLVLLLSACGGEAEPTKTPTPPPTATILPTPTVAGPPVVVIEAPPSNATAAVGEQVLIQSAASDDIGIARIDLLVDGALVRSDTTPEEIPQIQFALLQAWEPTAPGEHTVRVIAYRADGTASDPATIIVVVEEADQAAAGAAEQQLCSVTASTHLNVRQGPGVVYSRVGVLAMGEPAPVTGKNNNGSWWQIDYQGTPSWVAASHSYSNGDCEAIQVAAAPPPPPVAAETTIANTNTPTATPGGPTLTPSATYNASVTATYTPTPSPTQPTGGQVTTTYTPTPSPTQPTNGQATATYTPTPSVTATSTTAPTAQEAPPDANFNNPLNIPLDNTASALDFVSYPGGDIQDKIRWDIIGMNPNSSLSGGRARLILSVTCFGEGTQYIEFFTGGQTYSCGQTMVDQEVTADSRTGQVTITAVGGQGTYVQWVLTGTATRTN